MDGSNEHLSGNVQRPFNQLYECRVDGTHENRQRMEDQSDPLVFKNETSIRRRYPSLSRKVTAYRRLIGTGSGDPATLMR